MAKGIVNNSTVRINIYSKLKQDQYTAFSIFAGYSIRKHDRDRKV